MELQKIVAAYATKDGKTVNVDLKNLSADSNFRSEALAVILQQLEKKKGTCVVLPSFRRDNKNLGQLINELAASLKVKTLITGGITELEHVSQANKQEVVLVKQSFRAGQQLAEQIAAIKELGSKVSVICLISHSRAKLESFAEENDVEITALVYTDEL